VGGGKAVTQAAVLVLVTMLQGKQGARAGVVQRWKQGHKLVARCKGGVDSAGAARRWG